MLENGSIPVHLLLILLVLYTEKIQVSTQLFNENDYFQKAAVIKYSLLSLKQKRCSLAHHVSLTIFLWKCAAVSTLKSLMQFLVFFGGGRKICNSLSF